MTELEIKTAYEIFQERHVCEDAEGDNKKWVSVESIIRWSENLANSEGFSEYDIPRLLMALKGD